MAVTKNTDAVQPVRSSGPVTIWLLRHASCCVGALGKMARQPVASFMIILVIAITLALPAALHLLVKNVSVISGGWEQALDFSVFLEDGQTASEAEGLARLIEQRADVESVELVTSDQALEEFKELSGFGDALDQLSRNPLPHTLIVRPSTANTSQSMVLLREELQNLPETALVQIDTEWVQRFHAILAIVERSILIGAVLLAAAIITIIGNTIRLDIQNRRDEIEVTKLIGASNGFVRRPFLWSGFWYGAFGALLAIGLVQYGFALLRPQVTQLASLYQSNLAVMSLDMAQAGSIVLGGVLLGLLGSWFAAARHMRAIEPR
ncbi:MAG: permease-like cell division protein FtsX [Woeseiaceae bacterium]|nr:permease-like cell division protein FtsX [Woeseiaceae bacterium]